MKTSIFPTLPILQWTAAAALAGFALTGCMTKSESDVTTDGGNVVAAQEATNMGAVLGESASPSTDSVATADTVTDPITLERIVVPLHYAAGCQCFVRTAQFTASPGFERQRVDSIWLDSSNHLLSKFTPTHADSITHARHVTRINANTGKEIDLTFKTTLTHKITDSSNVYQWTGVMTGTFNGTEFKSKSLSMTLSYTVGSGFALSGTFDFQRGNFEIVIVFGNGSATCTVTRNGTLIRVTHIDSQGHET